MVGKLDVLDEGIVNRANLKSQLQAQKISELTDDELVALLRYCDKGHKGYISSSKFIDSLYSLASETESEVVLRRLAKSLAHSDINLKQEMSKLDNSGSGKLDKATFKKCLK